MSESELKTGTTTVGVICDDGLIFGADRKATAGHFIVDKNAKKIHMVGEKIAVTTSGSVSDLQLLTRLVRAETALKKYRTDLHPTVEETANLLAGMVYSNIRSFSAIPGITHFMLGGYDESGARLFDIFADGSITEVKTYFSSGSGSVFALGVLDTLYEKGLSKDQAVELVRKAIGAALQRDSASGEGLDIIFISASGVQTVVSEELSYQIK